MNTNKPEPEPSTEQIREWSDGNWGYVGTPDKSEVIKILLSRLKAAEEQVSKLRGYELLHKDGCQHWRGCPCTCGLDELLK